MTYAYVGCRTTKERNARGLGIQVYQVSQSTGEWKHIQTLENLVNPSYLAFDQTKNFLYSVHGDFSEISAFKVDMTSGKLSFINQVSTNGENPVHLAVDKYNKNIVVANLQTGNIAVIPIEEGSGRLLGVKHEFFIAGKAQGAVSHPHQTMFDGTAEYLLVPAQGRKAGYSSLTILKLDSAHSALEQVGIVPTREIAEARHIVLHRNNKYAYLVNERDNTVCFYEFAEKTGELIPKQVLPTLPETYTGEGQASGIVISKNGKYLYVSNRKHDSISMYTINQDNGMLKYGECVSTYGATPRFITLGERDDVLYAANEDSDNIIRYIIRDNGTLAKDERVVRTGSPVCIVFR